MSALRARCPDCRTLTAVAIGPEYQCHSCGARVRRRARPRPSGVGVGRGDDGRRSRDPAPLPRGGRRRRGDARGAGRDADAHAAGAAARPRRVLLLAHRRDPGARPHAAAGWPSSGWTRTAISTRPRRSPSGNAWGMPLRIVIDGGAIAPSDVALVGARNLDPPEVAYMAADRDRRRPRALPRRLRSRLRRLRCRRAPPRRACRLHAGARRADVGRSRGAPSRRGDASAPRGARPDGTPRRCRAGVARAARRGGRPLTTAVTFRPRGPV